MSEPGRKKRVLTGIKPTGIPHIGNYFGAIEPGLRLAREHESFLFIADLHGLTISPGPALLAEETYSVAATWLALGLDPKTTHFYRQSDIPEVTELAWILSCVTPMGLLQRAHTFKNQRDNKGVAPEDMRLGLFSYPILMAADILLFDANVVPVGKDQKQHLEICQEAARKINHIYGQGVLTIPEAQIDERVMTILGLDGRKMSKSYNNGIPIFSTKKQLKKLIGTIKTDSTAFGEPLSEDGETIMNLFELFASPSDIATLKERYRTGRLDPTGPNSQDNYFGWGHAKSALVEIMDARFASARETYDQLMADRAYIDNVLNEGAERVRPIAREVLGRVRHAVGIRRIR